MKVEITEAKNGYIIEKIDSGEEIVKASMIAKKTVTVHVTVDQLLEEIGRIFKD